eukprot:gene132-4378_t
MMNFPLNRTPKELLTIIKDLHSFSTGIERSEKRVAFTVYKDSFSGDSAVKWCENILKFSSEDSYVFLELLRAIGVFRNADDFRKPFNKDIFSIYQFTEIFEVEEDVEKIIIQNYKDIRTIRKIMLSEDSLQQLYADFVEQALEDDPSQTFNSNLALDWFSKTYNISSQASSYIENILCEYEMFQSVGNVQKKVFNSEANYQLINFMDFVDNLTIFIKSLKEIENFAHFTYYQDFEIDILELYAEKGKKSTKKKSQISSISFKSNRALSEPEIQTKRKSFLGFPTFGLKKLDSFRKFSGTNVFKKPDSTKQLTTIEKKGGFKENDYLTSPEMIEENRKLSLVQIPVDIDLDSPRSVTSDIVSPRIQQSPKFLMGMNDFVQNEKIRNLESPRSNNANELDVESTIACSPRSDFGEIENKEKKSTFSDFSNKLFELCLIGKFEEFQRVFKENKNTMNINMISNKTTLLHSAAKNNQPEILDFLIENGADLNILDTMERTPLHMAVSHGNSECVLILLGSSCRVNERDKYGYSPLYIAIKHHKFEIADILLLFNGDINFKKIDGSTILHNCFVHSNEKGLRYILNISPIKKLIYNPKDSNGETPLLKAMYTDDVKLLKIFLTEKRSEVKLNVQNTNGENIFHIAAKKNSFKSLLYLMSLDKTLINLIDVQDLTSRKFYPIQLAIQNSSEEVFQILISNGCAVNVKDAKGNTPLHYAVQNSNLNYATKLLKSKAKQLKNNEGVTPKKLKKIFESK